MGIIEEMIEDTLEMDDQDELEDEAEEEVEKILFELTAGLFLAKWSFERILYLLMNKLKFTQIFNVWHTHFWQ